MQSYKSLETVSHKTLLGVRFWDAAMDAPIADGLLASLSPTSNPEATRIARTTPSGIYAFHNIPGMRGFEVNQEETSQNANSGSPAPTKSFVLHVVDQYKRFSEVTAALDLPLPYNGIFLVDDARGSPSTPPKGFNLYSSVTRIGGSQYGFIRGQVIDSARQQPASHALIQVETERGFKSFAIADGEGQFSVMLPYPFVSMTLGGSPPSSNGVRLFERTWGIDLTVMYEPLSQTKIEGFDTPDYLSILSQPQASIFTHSPEDSGGAVNEFSSQLMYGRDLIVRTQGFSELYIKPIGSPE